MRRRLGTFIPFALLAVLVQLMAPIGISRAVAQTMSDPLATVPICSGMADAARDPSAPAAPAHIDCCSFCGIGYGGSIAPDAPAARSVERSYRHVVWHSYRNVSQWERVGSNAQARAPPTLA
jgi:hypothetical protein